MPDGDGQIAEGARDHDPVASGGPLECSPHGSGEDDEGSKPDQPMGLELVGAGLELVVGRVPLDVNKPAGSEGDHAPHH